MGVPTAYEVECPECGCPCSIRITDAHYYWLPRAMWRCPHCKSEVLTEEIQERDKKVEESGTEI